MIKLGPYLFDKSHTRNTLRIKTKNPRAGKSYPRSPVSEGADWAGDQWKESVMEKHKNKWLEPYPFDARAHGLGLETTAGPAQLLFSPDQDSPRHETRLAFIERKGSTLLTPTQRPVCPFR